MAIVGYWRMNGNSNDASGNGNNGTATSITYSQANGRLNQGAGFNGTSSKILKSSYSWDFSTNPFTISIWLKTNVSATTANGYSVIRIDNEFGSPRRLYGLQMSSTGFLGRIKLFLYDSSTGLSQDTWSIITINDGKWHNVVACRATAGTYIYIDGKLDNSNTANIINTSVVPTKTVAFGANTANDEFYSGSLDEIIIDNTAWSAAQVKNEYSRVKGFF